MSTTTGTEWSGVLISHSADWPKENRLKSTSYDISYAFDWSRRPSRPIKSIRYIVTCTRIRAQIACRGSRKRRYVIIWTVHNGSFDSAVDNWSTGQDSNTSSEVVIVLYIHSATNCSDEWNMQYFLWYCVLKEMLKCIMSHHFFVFHFVAILSEIEENDIRAFELLFL